MAYTFSSPILSSTINAWLKKIEEPVYHNNPLMGFMRKRGLIMYKPDEIGERLTWKVHFEKYPLRKIEGEVVDHTFNPTLPKQTAAIDWCGYALGVRITDLEKKINSSSKTRLYNLVEDALKQAMEDFLSQFALKLWQDGTQAANELNGYLSMYGGSSTMTADNCYNALGSYSPISGGTWWNCNPTKTYAELSTALGAVVNSHTGDYPFPYGQFPEGYHAWTPIVCDYNSRSFTPTGSSSTHSWDTQWQQAFNAVETYQSKTCAVPIDLWICDADLVMRAKNSLIDNTRFVVTDTSESRSLGFPAVNYNGWEILPGYGVPDGMCAGFTFDKMELRLLQDQLVEKKEDSDIRTTTDLSLLQTHCQMKFASPKYFPCMVPASTAGT